MSDPLAGLLAALALQDTGARTNEDIFTGPSQWMPQGRVFGRVAELLGALRAGLDLRENH